MWLSVIRPHRIFVRLIEPLSIFREGVRPFLGIEEGGRGNGAVGWRCVVGDDEGSDRWRVRIIDRLYILCGLLTFRAVVLD
jgi:hypothetical protein